MGFFEEYLAGRPESLTELHMRAAQQFEHVFRDSAQSYSHDTVYKEFMQMPRKALVKLAESESKDEWHHIAGTIKRQRRLLNESMFDESGMIESLWDDDSYQPQDNWFFYH